MGFCFLLLITILSFLSGHDSIGRLLTFILVSWLAFSVGRLHQRKKDDAGSDAY